MRLFLNGLAIKRELFTVNDGLNYNRFFNHEPQNYEIQLSILKLKELIEKEYIEIRDEIKEDDILNQDTSDFTPSNYCSLQDLFQYEANFEEVIKTYLDRILFLKLFPESRKSRYVINSTDSIKIQEDMVLIRGRVFDLKSNTQY